jgi:hypothetical protein
MTSRETSSQQRVVARAERLAGILVELSTLRPSALSRKAGEVALREAG